MGDTIHPIPPVPRSPILHDVDTSALQMVFEQMPETDARENADMGAIVDDNIESGRCVLACEFVEEAGVLLWAGIGADPSVRTVDTDRVDIEANDDGTRKILAPEIQRAAVLDAEFQEANLVVAQRREIPFIVLQIAGLNELICFVLPGYLAKA